MTEFPPISGNTQGVWPEALHAEAELPEGGERLLRHRRQRIRNPKESLGGPFLKERRREDPGGFLQLINNCSSFKYNIKEVNQGTLRLIT